MTLAFVQTALVTAMLIYDSVKDIKYREIPDEISAAIALTMVLDLNIGDLWGLAAAAVFFVAALVVGGIGGGDVKLVIALSVVCGLGETVFLLIAAEISMLVVYAVYAAVMKIKGRTAEKALPFVPFISFGYIMSTLIF